MNDNDRRNAIISAISHKESRLAELDNERYNVLAELKSLKTELLKLANHSPDSGIPGTQYLIIDFVFKIVKMRSCP